MSLVGKYCREITQKRPGTVVYAESYCWPGGRSQEKWHKRLLLLGDDVMERYSQHACPVSIIGWSLGGVYAREIAKEYPDLVRQVIILASPFGETDTLRRRRRHAPLVRSWSIYSQTDGIVNWESCVGKGLAGHRNIEVKGVSHFGMVHHPDVLKAVAEILRSPI